MTWVPYDDGSVRAEGAIALAETVNSAHIERGKL